MEAARIYTETGHYTEYPAGSKMYNDFWTEQYRRCKEGYTVGEYRITGDHYFFINFYRMETINEGTRGGGGRTQRFPSFLAKQYEFFHPFVPPLATPSMIFLRKTRKRMIKGRLITTTAAIIAGIFSRPKPFSLISCIPLETRK